MIRLAAASLLLLAGCANQGDPSVCGIKITERPAEIPDDPNEMLQAAYACVEQWSARLGRGSDPARDIATTVFAACNQELQRAETGAIQVYGAVRSFSPEVDTYWRGHSMFIVMQVRAGDCYKDA